MKVLILQRLAQSHTDGQDEDQELKTHAQTLVNILVWHFINQSF